MTYLRLTLLLLSLFGIFIAGGIYFRKDDIKHKTIAIFVLLLTIEQLDFLYGTSGIRVFFPTFAGLIFLPIGFLYGPLFFFHIKSVLGLTIKKVDFLHFIPLLIIIVSLTDVYALGGGNERGKFMTEHFFYRFLYYNYIRSFHILSYGLAVGIYFFKQGRYVLQTDRIYVFAILIIYSVWAIAIGLLTEFANGYRDFVLHYIIAGSIALVIGYLLYSDSPFLVQIGKYLRSSLSEKEMKGIAKKLEDEFVENKIFLKRDLTLLDLARAIEESSHRLSQTLSVYVEKNFNDYINHHRIKFAKELLMNPEFDHYKIEAIAIDSGFNNKVTFYKAFTKETGTTPTAYKKALKSSE